MKPGTKENIVDSIIWFSIAVILIICVLGLSVLAKYLGLV